MSIPVELSNVLQALFIDSKAYGQVATVSKQGIPSVRTVHIHVQPNDFSVHVNTNTHSEKWIDLASSPYISGCYWSKEAAIQVRFQALAQRLSETDATNNGALTSMWMEMRDEVRLTYHLNDKDIPLYQKEVSVDPTPHSPSHGIITGDVFRWDVFWEGQPSYRFGRRSIFNKNKDGSWAKKDVSSLHEQPILLYDRDHPKG